MNQHTQDCVAEIQEFIDRNDRNDKKCARFVKGLAEYFDPIEAVLILRAAKKAKIIK